MHAHSRAKNGRCTRHKTNRDARGVSKWRNDDLRYGNAARSPLAGQAHGRKSVSGETWCLFSRIGLTPRRQASADAAAAAAATAAASSISAAAAAAAAAAMSRFLRRRGRYGAHGL